MSVTVFVVADNYQDSRSLAVNPLCAISYSQNILPNAPPLAAKPVVRVAICSHNSNWKAVAGESFTDVLILRENLSGEHEPLGKAPYRW